MDGTAPTDASHPAGVWLVLAGTLGNCAEQNDRQQVGAQAYLGALADLVYVYEQQHVSWPPVTGVDVVRHLMDVQSSSARFLTIPHHDPQQAGKARLKIVAA